MATWSPRSSMYWRSSEAADVDEDRRRGQAQLHQRHQRVAAGEELGLVAVLDEGGDGRVGRVDPDVVERGGDHCETSTPCRRRRSWPPRARPGRCCGSRCSGRGCPRGPRAPRPRTGPGSRRAATWRPSPCPACSTRTGGRGSRGTPAASGAAASADGARPSMVVTAPPSAWTASTVQDFTDSPSRWSVQAPHDDVSHPMFVPVSPTASRMYCTSSVRGSTSWRLLGAVDGDCDLHRVDPLCGSDCGLPSASPAAHVAIDTGSLRWRRLGQYDLSTLAIHSRSGTREVDHGPVPTQADDVSSDSATQPAHRRDPPSTRLRCTPASPAAARTATGSATSTTST